MDVCSHSVLEYIILMKNKFNCPCICILYIRVHTDIRSGLKLDYQHTAHLPPASLTPKEPYLPILLFRTFHTYVYIARLHL